MLQAAIAASASDILCTLITRVVAVDVVIATQSELCLYPCPGKKAAAKAAAERRAADGDSEEEEEDDEDQPGGANPFAALVDLQGAVNAAPFVPHK